MHSMAGCGKSSRFQNTSASRNGCPGMNTPGMPANVPVRTMSISAFSPSPTTRASGWNMSKVLSGSTVGPTPPSTNFACGSFSRRTLWISSARNRVWVMKPMPTRSGWNATISANCASSGSGSKMTVWAWSWMQAASISRPTGDRWRDSIRTFTSATRRKAAAGRSVSL